MNKGRFENHSNVLLENSFAQCNDVPPAVLRVEKNGFDVSLVWIDVKAFTYGPTSSFWMRS
jgi:hypothetical protein